MFESFDFQQMISAFIVLFAVIDINGKQADWYRQQNNTEELPDNIDSAFSKKAFDTGCHANDKIDPYHIQY